LPGDIGRDNEIREMQNQAIGLRGNVVFEATRGPSTGVIYRCGK